MRTAPIPQASLKASTRAGLMGAVNSSTVSAGRKMLPRSNVATDSTKVSSMTALTEISRMSFEVSVYITLPSAPVNDGIVAPLSCSVSDVSGSAGSGGSMSSIALSSSAKTRPNMMPKTNIAMISIITHVFISFLS